MATLPKVKTLTAPTEYPVCLEEAKEQAVIEHSDSDAFILRLIAAATNHVETVTGQSVVRQQKRLYLDKFQDAVFLPKGPVKTIQQIQYIDADGATQTLSSSTYEYNDADGYLRLAYGQTWPSTRNQANAVWIDYWAGYFDDSGSPIDNTANIPEDLKHAVLMLVAEYDRNRESENELETFENRAFDALIGPYREYVL